MVLYFMNKLIVIDTNIIISSLLNPFGLSATILELCFQGRFRPLVGTTLFLEYEDVIYRETIFKECLLTDSERGQVLDDILSISKWIRVYYSWRPNLKDEGDNHLLELAVAGGARTIVTNNVKDFRKSDLSFPEIAILSPRKFLEDEI